MLGGEGGKENVREGYPSKNSEQCKQSSEAERAAEHGHNCKPSMWIKDGFPEGSY